MKCYKFPIAIRGVAVLLFLISIVVTIEHLLTLSASPMKQIIPGFIWIEPLLTVVILTDSFLSLLIVATYKFVIDEDSISLIRIWSKRKVLITEIKGYHHGASYLQVLLHSDKKNMSIPNYLANSHEIFRWLGSNFKKL